MTKTLLNITNSKAVFRVGSQLKDLEGKEKHGQCFMFSLKLNFLDENYSLRVICFPPKIEIFDLLTKTRSANKGEMCLINLLFALLESQALCSQPGITKGHSTWALGKPF